MNCRARSLREYAEQNYLPASAAHRATCNASAGKQIAEWQSTLENSKFSREVGLDDLDSKVVRVEIYADGINRDNPVRQEMIRGRQLVGAALGFIYRASVSAQRPATDYTARVIPNCAGVQFPSKSPASCGRREPRHEP